MVSEANQLHQHAEAPTKMFQFSVYESRLAGTKELLPDMLWQYQLLGDCYELDRQYRQMNDHNLTQHTKTLCICSIGTMLDMQQSMRYKSNSNKHYYAAVL